MRCSEIMKRNVKLLTEGDSVKKAALMMRNDGVGFLPVCNDDGRVTGVVTDRDIVTRAVADEKAPTSTAVSSIMTRDVVTCSPDDTLAFAEMRMRNKGKNRIVCVDAAGKPVGVISGSDVRVRNGGGRLSRALRALTSRDAQL